ncbi:MAG: ROK family protein [Pedobacter sp.]|jgi:glucokinase
MSVLGIDLGGTKAAIAMFSETGELIKKETAALDHRIGSAVARLVCDMLKDFIGSESVDPVRAVGVSVPGISRSKSGTVWAPNIKGWEDYPLLKELQSVCGTVPVSIDSDRACYILGELWQGNAKGCKDAIYLSVGTGIGAGILINGSILRGSQDIAGCIGWMALDRPFKEKYISCGCFEYYASGEGIAKVARELLVSRSEYSGELRDKYPEKITAADVFKAYEQKDVVAVEVMKQCVEFWGMAVANLISLFNPEKIIFGGGVFGPGVQFISDIQQEANKWAQPISAKQVSMEESGTGGNAGVIGAAYLALQAINI